MAKVELRIKALFLLLSFIGVQLVSIACTFFNLSNEVSHIEVGQENHHHDHEHHHQNAGAISHPLGMNSHNNYQAKKKTYKRKSPPNTTGVSTLFTSPTTTNSEYI